MQRIYFDANAGVPLLPEAREAAVSALDAMANASSVHAEGRRARATLETARSEIAAAVGAEPQNVVFTSGATEAAALALTPQIRQRPAGRLYVGATEHRAVLSSGRFAAADVSVIPVEPSGVVDLAALERMLAAHDADSGAPFVALMLANNESGVIHPVAEAVRMTKAHRGHVFCDAVQALGRIPVDIGVLGVDSLAVSSNKIGGPQGAGALVLADEAVHPAPLLTGGGQERGHRAGTENVSAVAGFGVAARLTRHHLSDAGRMAALRDDLEDTLAAVSPDVVVFGRETERLPNTTLFALPGLEAETAVIAFDLEGIAVSAGSACSSGKVGRSHVLEAMGVPQDVARSGIRVSLTNSATQADVEAFIAAWRVVSARIDQVKAV